MLTLDRFAEKATPVCLVVIAVCLLMAVLPTKPKTASPPETILADAGSPTPTSYTPAPTAKATPAPQTPAPTVADVENGEPDPTAVYTPAATGDSLQDRVIAEARNYLGTPYARTRKEREQSPKYLDCSSFVYLCMKKTGTAMAKMWDGTAADQAEWCLNKGYVIDQNDEQTGHRADMSKLRPGDLIFWNKPDCTCFDCSTGERWGKVHHVGIYTGKNSAGEDMIIEASYKKGFIVERRLWEGAEIGYVIFMIARPYNQE